MVKAIASKYAQKLNLNYDDPNRIIYGLLNPAFSPEQAAQIRDIIWAREIWGLINTKWDIGLQGGTNSLRFAAHRWYGQHLPEFLEEMHLRALQDPKFGEVHGRDLTLWIFEDGAMYNESYTDIILMPAFSLDYHKDEGYSRRRFKTKELLLKSKQYLATRNLLQLIIAERAGLPQSQILPGYVARIFGECLEARLSFRDNEDFSEILNPSQLIESLITQTHEHIETS